MLDAKAVFDLLFPRTEVTDWWAGLDGEANRKKPGGRHLVDTLDAWLELERVHRSTARGLPRGQYFFSPSSQSCMDRRLDGVGVEEKVIDLSFGKLIDGALGRSLVWVLGGHPDDVAEAAAIGLCVVKPSSPPMSGEVANALVPAFVAARREKVHVVFVNGLTGERWPTQLGARDALPPWLSEIPEPKSWDLDAVSLADVDAVALELRPSKMTSKAFGRRAFFVAKDGPTGAKIAIASWPNHWQMLDVGLALRGRGYSAVKVFYSGTARLAPAMHGVEEKVATAMKSLFGVVLDWSSGITASPGDAAKTMDGSRNGVQASPSMRSRFLGCMLGGAVGDALGAPVEFLGLREILARFGPDGLRDFAPAYGKLGAITDDTQMALFTAEGLLRAEVRGQQKGICHPPSVVRHAYLRWLQTQGSTAPCSFCEQPPDGWLATHRELWSRRGPGKTCLSALETGKFGTIAEPLNDSKGCGAIMRIAPVGLVANDPYELGMEVGALTHGHVTGYLAAAYFADVIGHLVRGAELRAAIDLARAKLEENHCADETLMAIDRAVALAEKGPSAQAVESLGAGWIAEEALAISLYAALAARTFEEGLVLAVNHSGDSDSTGALTGNLLGTMLGIEAVPARWLDLLELRAVVEEVALDLALLREGSLDTERLWTKYPGW